MPERERSFIMIKPDGVQRGLVGEIIKRFEQKGFKLVAMKMVQVCYFCTRFHTGDKHFFFYRYFNIKIINLILNFNYSNNLRYLL